MRHFTTGVSLFLTFLISLFAMSVLICSAKMTAFLTKREAGLAVSRGTIGVIEAEKAIDSSLKEDGKEVALEAFDQISMLLYDQGTSISEERANEIFKKRFYNNIKIKWGENNGTIHSYLESKLPEIKTGKLSIDECDVPKFVEEDGVVSLKNIPVRYEYKNIFSRRTIFDAKVTAPEIVLYDGNDEVFSYSLIAKKGIYITGKTSTIFGNIYAGTHGPEEMRKSEALYGEKERYGGLNIMSTQLAVYGDKIISEGDINLRGSFVLFGSEDEPADVYCVNINQIDNIAQKNIFGHVGNETTLTGKSKEFDLINEATESFEDIIYYYDSNNDKEYKGKYRKIISSTDVTLKTDITGIIMTPRSVIIEEGVNVEGLIIAGDRIYIQGNNNIVSSMEVLHRILKEELRMSDVIYIKDESKTSEDDGEESVQLKVSDYLGGIKYRGIVE